MTKLVVCAIAVGLTLVGCGRKANNTAQNSLKPLTSSDLTVGDVNAQTDNLGKVSARASIIRQESVAANEVTEAQSKELQSLNSQVDKFMADVAKAKDKFTMSGNDKRPQLNALVTAENYGKEVKKQMQTVTKEVEALPLKKPFMGPPAPATPTVAPAPHGK